MAHMVRHLSHAPGFDTVAGVVACTFVMPHLSSIHLATSAHGWAMSKRGLPPYASNTRSNYALRFSRPCPPRPMPLRECPPEMVSPHAIRASLAFDDQRQAANHELPWHPRQWWRYRWRSQWPHRGRTCGRCRWPQRSSRGCRWYLPCDHVVGVQQRSCVGACIPSVHAPVSRVPAVRNQEQGEAPVRTPTRPMENLLHDGPDVRGQVPLVGARGLVDSPVYANAGARPVGHQRCNPIEVLSVAGVFTYPLNLLSNPPLGHDLVADAGGLGRAQNLERF